MSDVTIPEDVWDEARKAIMEAELHPAKPPQIRVVARAILAERERCARMAEETGRAIAEHAIGHHIAQAIRSSHE